VASPISTDPLEGALLLVEAGRKIPSSAIPIEEEVNQALSSPLLYLPVPTSFTKDTLFTQSSGFLGLDDNRYLSAGWEGDCYTFAKEFCKLIRHSAAGPEEVRTEEIIQ